jgi:hypothetical protein
VAQIWRGGSGRQVEVARLLAGVDVKPVDEQVAKKAGLLLATSRTDDAIDAVLICLAVDGDEILTSDPEDLKRLAVVAGLHIDLVPV